MQVDSETIKCACGEDVLVETIYRYDGTFDQSKHGCKCKKGDLKESLDRFFQSKLIEAINDNNIEKIAQEIDENSSSKLPLDKRIEIMKYNVSSVNRDMIKSFYLKDSKVEIPDSYFWKIKVDNPRLCVADFIEHIWRLQREGIDPATGEAKFVVFDSNRRIDGRWQKVQAGITVFSYKHMMKKARQENDYDGYTNESGVGDYFNVENSTVSQQQYASCTIHFKNRRDLNYTAWLPEFIKLDKNKKPIGSWKRPMVMLQKTAINNAHRQAFPEKLDFLVDTNNEFTDMEE